MEKDEKLNDRTVLSVQNIIELLGFCLHNTYFSFQNKFYEQIEGVAIGSPVSPIVANLYMENFERKALGSATYPTRVWYRFVDDMWVIQKQAHKQAFLDHINNIDLAIKFIVEGTQGNGAIPFLDTLVTQLADNSLSFKVYWKLTHTDQYLQWNSHSLSAKYSVRDTLTHRAEVVCMDLGLLQSEINHSRRALKKCKYPNWAINKVQHKILSNNWEDTTNNNLTNSSNNNNNPVTITQTRDNNNSPKYSNSQGNNPNRTRSGNKATVGQIVIPYTKGIAESIKQICGMYGIQVHFKGNTTIKQILMKLKDQDPMDKKVASYTVTSAII